MLLPNTVCAHAAPTRRAGPASLDGLDRLDRLASLASLANTTVRAAEFSAGTRQAGPCNRLPDRGSLRRGKSPGTGLLATLLVILLAALLVSGCGFKTPLELPKRAPPAKSAS